MPGQLMVSIEGITLDISTRTRLSQPDVGGVILFARNFASVDQLVNLTAVSYTHLTLPTKRIV